MDENLLWKESSRIYQKNSIKKSLKSSEDNFENVKPMDKKIIIIIIDVITVINQCLKILYDLKWNM